jgi:hypothetical protein
MTQEEIEEAVNTKKNSSIRYAVSPRHHTTQTCKNKHKEKLPGCLP